MTSHREKVKLIKTEGHESVKNKKKIKNKKMKSICAKSHTIKIFFFFFALVDSFIEMKINSIDSAAYNY